MIIKNQHITDYIFCPYRFSKNVLSNNKQSGMIKLHFKYEKFKDFISKIASYELKNMHKYNHKEYTIKYFNEFPYNGKKLFNDAILNDETEYKINNMLSIFSDNTFIGYNIPIEIPIPGTNIIYKHNLNYGLSDEKKELTFIQIIDLKADDFTSDQLNWSHWSIIGSYLANAFKKKIQITFLDPVNLIAIDKIYQAQLFEQDLEDLKKIACAIDSGLLYKNYFNCYRCLIKC